MTKKNESVPEKGGMLLYQTEDGKTRIEVRLQDETVWLTQKLMAELFQTSVPNINMHINNIFEEGELEPDSVIKEFLITAADGALCGAIQMFPTHVGMNRVKICRVLLQMEVDKRGFVR